MNGADSTPTIDRQVAGRCLADSTAELIDRFASVPVFREAGWDEQLIDRNPFRRPMRAGDHGQLDVERPLVAPEIGGNRSLAVHRLLFNIYETDLLFLPLCDTDAQWADMKSFYADETRMLAEAIRPALERCAFEFLDHEVEVAGPWNAHALESYFRDFAACRPGSSSAVLKELRVLPGRQACARFYLIQFACDFLSEASSMARNVLGNAGVITSELFKILIDEYGYGVFDCRHATLFERTLASAGLRPEIHTYWQQYLPGSLMLANYFHRVSRDHRYFLRYLGALMYTETALVHLSAEQSRLLREIFGTSIDTRYFDEHAHIDAYHGRMAFENLTGRILAAYRDEVAIEIVRGFEEFRRLEELADAALLHHLGWAAGVSERRRHSSGRTTPSGDPQVAARGASRRETFVETAGERSTGHVHDDDRLLVIERGRMEFWCGVGGVQTLTARDSLWIPRHCLHGSAVTSAECVYHQYAYPDGHAPDDLV